jgi:hypothetical protein
MRRRDRRCSRLDLVPGHHLRPYCSWRDLCLYPLPRSARLCTHSEAHANPVRVLQINITSYEIAYVAAPQRMKGLVFALVLFMSALSSALALIITPTFKVRPLPPFSLFSSGSSTDCSTNLSATATRTPTSSGPLSELRAQTSPLPSASGSSSERWTMRELPPPLSVRIDPSRALSDPRIRRRAFRSRSS